MLQSDFPIFSLFHPLKTWTDKDRYIDRKILTVISQYFYQYLNYKYFLNKLFDL